MVANRRANRIWILRRGNELNQEMCYMLHQNILQRRCYTGDVAMTRHPCSSIDAFDAVDPLIARTSYSLLFFIVSLDA